MACGTPQKVIIPKGMIQPGETTIVEIPRELKCLPTVVAQRKLPRDQSKQTTSSRMASKRSLQKKTSPNANPAESLGEVAVAMRTPLCEYPYREGRQEPDMMAPANYDEFQRQEMEQSLDDEDAYAQWKPQMSSTPIKGHRQQSAQQMPTYNKNYRYQSVEVPSYTEITTEQTETYYETGGSSGAYQHFDSPGNSYLCPPPATAQPGNSSGGISSDMRRFTDELAGADISYDVPTCDQNCPNSNVNVSQSGTSKKQQMTQSDLMDSLGSLEKCELSKIMNDLSSYQIARRKLIMDASSLSSASELSRQLLQRNNNANAV